MHHTEEIFLVDLDYKIKGLFNSLFSNIIDKPACLHRIETVDILHIQDYKTLGAELFFSVLNLPLFLVEVVAGRLATDTL